MRREAPVLAAPQVSTDGLHSSKSINNVDDEAPSGRVLFTMENSPELGTQGII